MSKSKRKQFEKLKQAMIEQASLRAQEAVRRGLTFEHFKKIADDLDIPESVSIFAGYKK
jgi:hypothetical protein